MPTSEASGPVGVQRTPRESTFASSTLLRLRHSAAMRVLKGSTRGTPVRSMTSARPGVGDRAVLPSPPGAGRPGS